MKGKNSGRNSSVRSRAEFIDTPTSAGGGCVVLWCVLLTEVVLLVEISWLAKPVKKAPKQGSELLVQAARDMKNNEPHDRLFCIPCRPGGQPSPLHHDLNNDVLRKEKCVQRHKWKDYKENSFLFIQLHFVVYGGFYIILRVNLL